MRDREEVLNTILALHDAVRDEIVAATERRDPAALAAVDRDDESDTIYAIDVVGEAVVTRLAERLARDQPVVMIAEGLPGGRRCYPDGADEAAAAWRVIVDPIDGTRGLMYQKRSAWILTGAAPNRGRDTSLRDIELAVQTEIPLVKQHLSDQMWALRDGGVQAQRFNRLTGEAVPIRLRPSTAATIEHGYASIVRFFPGARLVLTHPALRLRRLQRGRHARLERTGRSTHIRARWSQPSTGAAGSAPLHQSAG